jgi:SAM-dependent methyltransferase
MYFNALDLWTRVSLGAVLHLAPERHFGSLVRDVAASYIAGDLQPKNENEVMVDLTDTIFPDGSFDIVIANHVFEHIRNDAAAFRETARILRPGGVAIVNTPYSPIIQSSLECADLKDEELLNFLFGQEDHVRIYGTDFFDKLRAVGLEVQLASHVDVLTQSPLKYGVNEQEPLIMAFKP